MASFSLVMRGKNASIALPSRSACGKCTFVLLDCEDSSSVYKVVTGEEKKESVISVINREADGVEAEIATLKRMA